jgi:hypothetical protein
MINSRYIAPGAASKLLWHLLGNAQDLKRSQLTSEHNIGSALPTDPRLLTPRRLRSSSRYLESGFIPRLGSPILMPIPVADSKDCVTQTLIEEDHKAKVSEVLLLMISWHFRGAGGGPD